MKLLVIFVYVCSIGIGGLALWRIVVALRDWWRE